MQLLSEFSVFLERLLLLPAELHILDDFNFYIDDMAVSGSKHGSNHIFENSSIIKKLENSSIIKDINVFPANLMIVWYKPRQHRKGEVCRQDYHLQEVERR